MPLEVTNKVVIVADHPTITGRIYPRHELLKVVDESKDKEFFGTFAGCDIEDSLKSVIKSRNIRMEGNSLIADFTILDTPYGWILQKMIDSNHQLALAPRGVGITEHNNVVNDYQLYGIDVRLT